MKKCFLIMLVVVVGLSLTGIVSAADKDAIKVQVDEIAVAIEGGKPASDFMDAAKNKPHYVFIMEESGNVLVHPSLVGKSLKEAAPPAYDAVVQATLEGNWVMYEWDGKEKNTYVRKTKTGVIVGSGY
jgi:hypothetical protein